MRGMESVRAILTVITLSACTPVMSQSIRNYDVNFTSNNIVADGIISPGEWDGAAPAAGGWRNQRQSFDIVDIDNNRFSMLYDADNLYILYESDYDFGFLTNPRETQPQYANAEEHLNIYIDPNRDGDFNTDLNGDPLSPDDLSASRVDGYQIAFNQYLGTTVSTGSDREGVGFLTEAHVNSPFGDRGNWNNGGASGRGSALNNRNIVVGQTNSNSKDVPAFTATSAHSIAEVIIPFADLDADSMVPDGDGGMMPTGLNATDDGTRPGPAVGEVWGFNSSLIIRRDLRHALPIWNWNAANSAAFWPHGTIAFQEVPEPSTALTVLMAVLSGLAMRRVRMAPI